MFVRDEGNIKDNAYFLDLIKTESFPSFLKHLAVTESGTDLPTIRKLNRKQDISSGSIYILINKSVITAILMYIK